MKKLSQKKSSSSILRFLKQLFSIIGIGTLLTLIILYFSYYPDINLEIKEVIKTNEFASNPIILVNPNPYKIENIVIKMEVDIGKMIMFPSKITITNSISSNIVKFESLKPKQKRRITTRSLLNMNTIYMLDSTTFTLKISYETPFYYPNIDSIRFCYDVEKNQFEKTVFTEKNIKY